MIVKIEISTRFYFTRKFFILNSSYSFSSKDMCHEILELDLDHN